MEKENCVKVRDITVLRNKWNQNQNLNVDPFSPALTSAPLCADFISLTALLASPIWKETWYHQSKTLHPTAYVSKKGELFLVLLRKIPRNYLIAPARFLCPPVNQPTMSGGAGLPPASPWQGRDPRPKNGGAFPRRKEEGGAAQRNSCS